MKARIQNLCNSRYNFFKFDPTRDMCNGTLFVYAVLVTIGCDLFLVLMICGFITYIIQARLYPKVTSLFRSPYEPIGEENA